MDCASILYAFDNPRQKEHILLNDADKDERRKIARELHDEIGQSLTGLKMSLRPLIICLIPGKLFTNIFPVPTTIFFPQ
jgi:nitrate/nitrite-specific signal transduction histidine kinase